MTDINNCEPADPHLLDFQPPLPLNLFNVEDNTDPPVPESGIVMESEIIGVYERDWTKEGSILARERDSDASAWKKERLKVV